MVEVRILILPFFAAIPSSFDFIALSTFDHLVGLPASVGCVSLALSYMKEHLPAHGHSLNLW
jgi:hypothetical protein